MKYYLVRYRGNWADEFDVYFHQVMSDTELAELKDAIASTNWNNEEFYFGTNEALDFSTSELMSYLENVEEINEEQFKVLQELDLLSVSFGDGLNWDSILECAEEYLKEDE